MKKLLLAAVLTTLCVSAAFAQTAPPSTDSAPYRLSLVKNAPYTADQVADSVQKLADGNEIKRSTRTRTYRDSAGRERSDELAGDGSIQRIYFSDIDGMNYTLDPRSKSAQKMPRFASFLPPKAPATLKTRTSSGFTTTELGVREIEGIMTEGRRMTHEIEPGRLGNRAAIASTTETWSAPELGLTMLSTSISALNERTTRVVSLTRGEPAPELLANLLSGYTLVAKLPSSFLTSLPEAPHQ